MPMPMPPGLKPQELKLPWVPDQELIRELRNHGMPAKDAIAGVDYGPTRLFATAFYFDVRDAGRGDKEAKERVDYCRHIWNEQAKREAQRVRDGVPEGVVIL